VYSSAFFVLFQGWGLASPSCVASQGKLFKLLLGALPAYRWLTRPTPSCDFRVQQRSDFAQALLRQVWFASVLSILQKRPPSAVDDLVEVISAALDASTVLCNRTCPTSNLVGTPMAMCACVRLFLVQMTDFELRRAPLHYDRN